MPRQKKQQTKVTDILGSAMLVRAQIGVWSARKHDRQVTQHVNEEYAASPTAGRYHKHLFGGPVPELSSANDAAQVARVTHYKNTLPWDDVGWRLLTSENYFEYTKAMRKAGNVVVERRRALREVYPKLVRQAQEALNGMWKKGDYPTAEEVESKFYVTIEYAPIPAGSDFRMDLPAEELKRVAKDVEERVARSVEDAMQEVWNRLGAVVVELRDKLVDGKHLRESKNGRTGLLDRVREVAERLGRLNITKDPALEQAREAVLRDLGSLDVHTMREDEVARETARAAADDILKSMKSFFTPEQEA